MDSAPQNQTERAPPRPGSDKALEETHFRLLRLLEARPDLSQRDLARELGTSLGKINYCLNALIDRGLIKARNFRNSHNKLGYAYLLTPRAIDSKATIALQFLKRKVAEYELLQKEIEHLQREVGASSEHRAK